MKSFKKGDKVAWSSHGSTAHGTVEKKLTKPTMIKGHKAAASPDDPQYLVHSDRKEGKDGRAAHKPNALSRE